MKDKAQNPDEKAPRRTTQNQPATNADPNASFRGTEDEHRPGENLYTLPEMQEQQPRNPTKPNDTPPATTNLANDGESQLDRETHGQLLDDVGADKTDGASGQGRTTPIIAQSAGLEDNNRENR
ncbi:hypothetical protein LJY25_19365 [Hymenobacter sp. BT175]|uniref:hypothetical protein n=1 Tax=Hymenobacter translucens TaxID=2886507 RepID=UPI001D0EEC43|nr:hypothetical protein [Hymenobacter translucens]MCC2548616.1 hypothetical protein [Hymenobacter translucens]